MLCKRMPTECITAHHDPLWPQYYTNENHLFNSVNKNLFKNDEFDKASIFGSTRFVKVNLLKVTLKQLLFE